MNLLQNENEIDLSPVSQLYQRAEFPLFVIDAGDWSIVYQNDAFGALLGKQMGKTSHNFLETHPAILRDLNHFATTRKPMLTIPISMGHRNREEHFRFLLQTAGTEGSKNLIMASAVPDKLYRDHGITQSIYNLIQQSPVAMGVLKGEKLIVEIANPKLLEIWGKQEDEVLGKPAFDQSPEIREQGFEALMLNVMQTGQPFLANEQLVQINRDGKTVDLYLNFVYEPLREDDGSISGILLVVTDVTEQVRSRHAIAIAEERARQAIDSAHLGAYLLNYKTEELQASDRFYQIWGMDESATRQDFVAKINPEDLKKREEAHARALQTGKLFYEIRFTRHDEVRWLRANGQMLFDGQGNPEFLVGVVQDITEQKSFSDALARQVDERTHELKAANEKLEQSNEELEQFAYIASHDLQEPLRKISLFSRMILEQHQLPPDPLKYMEKIVNASSRMTGLIKNLLDYSRVSQKIELFDTVNLKEVAENVVQDLEVMISQKDADIIIGNLPTIRAIPLQMNQLFYNLMGNALKFARRGVKSVVKVQAEKLALSEAEKYLEPQPDVQYYRITFSDNGIGFKQEYADKIFTIFQRLNENALYGGYGIGLALCRKIVNTHHGIIYATGNLGEGANFNIIIPEQP